MRKMALFATSALAAVASVTGATAANAAVINYVFSSDPSDPTQGPGQLNPGTLTGGFTFDTTTSAYSDVSLTVNGVQSTNLNGDYVLDTTTTSDASNLRVRGVTPNNSGGESNLNSFLNVAFGSPLGGASSQVVSITNYAGNAANLTTPPTVAYAVGPAVVDPGAVPEPATWGLMLIGTAMVGAGLRARRRTVTYA